MNLDGSCNHAPPTWLKCFETKNHGRFCNPFPIENFLEPPLDPYEHNQLN